MRIVNVRDHGGVAAFVASGGVYCGRPSPLGNPFVISGSITREDAIAMYRAWLWERIQARDEAVLAALAALTEESVLGCWCRPLACHTSVIEKAWQWCKSAGVI